MTPRVRRWVTIVLRAWRKRDANVDFFLLIARVGAADDRSSSSSSLSLAPSLSSSSFSHPLTLPSPHLANSPTQQQEKRVVILLTGRHAGKKAAIVRNYDDGAGGRRYGHALVVGLARAPRKVTRKSSEAKQAKASKLRAFVKVVNYTHVMPTRYTLDVDLKTAVGADATDSPAKRAEARKASKELLEEKFKTGKNRWFFTKLRF